MIKELDSKTATLSRRILSALIDRGLTQSTIAEVIGANRSHISRIKNGEHQFTDTQLEKIERFTAIPLGLLLLGAAPQSHASAAVRQLHKEAQRLLVKSAAVRRRL